MTSLSPIVTPQPCLPAAANAQSWPTPAVRADPLFLDETNHTAAAGSVSDPLATAGQSRKPTPQLPPQPTPATPSPPNASRQTPPRG
jgi:hypothetical protein